MVAISCPHVKSMAILKAVNMTLSKRGDYVVRSGLSLARAYPVGESRKIREVVAEMGVPRTFASQILAELVQADLATSRAGKNGGYRLSRPPDTIRVLDLVEAGEGPLRPERCALGDGPCRWQAICPLHETWRAATEALRAVLAAATLADLADRDRSLELGLLPVPSDSPRQTNVETALDDWVQIEEGLDAVSRALGGQRLVGSALDGAYREGESLRARLHPQWPTWTAESVAVALGSATLAAPEERSITLAWEVITVDAVPSHGEVHLRLRPLDQTRTELGIQGWLRAPATPAGLAGSSAQTDRIVQAVVRAFLRQVAGAIEGQARQEGSRPGAPPSGGAV